MLGLIQELAGLIFSSNIITIFLLCVVFVLAFWRKLLEKHLYPPGPLPLPFIGNDIALFAESRHAYRYYNWKRYGNVVSFVSLGSWNVLLFGYDAIHEAFVKNAEHCSARKMPITQKAHGLVFSSQWKEQRRLALIVLRDFGMGKAKVESKIAQELEYNLELLATLEGKQSSRTFKEVVGKGICNIINQVVFGRRLDYADKQFARLLKVDGFFAKQLIASRLPFYKFWPLDPLKLKEYTGYWDEVSQFIAKEIQEHKANLDVNEPKDYIDYSLAEGVKTGDEIYSNEEEITASVRQLFLGGYDTTSTTLTWSVLFLVNYPSAQQRVYEEIQEVVGNRSVSLADKDSMHFTQAFLQELMRCGPVAWISLTHLCTADIVVQGHTIPKDTVVMASLYSTYHDEDIYPDSYTFHPDRFLDENGEFVRPSSKQMLPFSIGKRACPGEALARAELFMMFVAFVQRFEVKRLTEEKVREDGINIFSYTPREFDFILKQRL
ncbi:cytochrome P450 2C37-like [Watersipora subatra]|uniref:cytochrome P450 2C37-like n=1 Tax=Watersipora subatra TaxID=2589382 RepID=UPI00355C15DE